MIVKRTLAGRVTLECKTAQDELVLGIIIALAGKGTDTLPDSTVRKLVTETIERIKGV